MAALFSSVALLQVFRVAGASYWLPATELQPLVVSELGWGVPPNITENTLPAFAEGLRLGASGVEVTSRLTADGRVALIHDLWSMEHQVVPWTKFADLPEGTLELPDFLEAVAPHGMNIMMQNNKFELGYDSSHRLAEVVVDTVLEAGLQDLVLLSAFDLDTVKHAREYCNGCGIRTAWLELSWKTRRAAGEVWAPELNSSQYLDIVERAGLDAFNPEAIIVDRELMEQAQDRGIQVFVWWMGISTSSEESLAAMQRMADCGITGFITPRVQMGLQALAGKSPASGEMCDVGFDVLQMSDGSATMV